jgi:hypothetical protein
MITYNGRHIMNSKHLVFCIVLLITACGGGGDGSGRNSIFSTNPDGDFRPADSTSAYKSVLVKCITAEKESEICRLSQLPFIGQSFQKPTKADILARTVVTHPWMAERFGQLLDQMPGDILLLFRGVTGIAIGADIRPSYYWGGTGAIYLDPADLWLNDTERKTISNEPDFREGFAKELKFSSPWRYVKDGRYAWEYYSLDGAESTRPLSAIVLPMAALLFHELAHANDNMPPVLLSQVNSQNFPWQQIDANDRSAASTDLTARNPLTSAEMFGLAKVMFHGDKASEIQKLLSPAQVGAYFEIDGASDTYNYSSQYEDTAMLFEEVMMKYHFQVNRELAYADSGDTCETVIVRWGQRNRIGNETVKARAQIVVPQLLGITDTTKYFSAIAQPVAMQNGISWCDSVARFSPVSGAGKLQKISAPEFPMNDLRRPYD